MRLQFISRDNTPGLIVIFAGWAMDYRPFEKLRVDGYDIAVVWDYVSTKLDTTQLSGYEEIIVVAWSFGVTAAARFISENPELPITSRIAINGTQHPVDNRSGIPEIIFNATLDNLSTDSLTKFYRRMAVSGAAFRQFMETAPQRDIDGLRDELKAIASREHIVIKWDTAFIGLDDRIIPPENQQRAWSSEAVRVVTMPSPHLPDFNKIISTTVTDKQLVASRFGNAMGSYDTNAEVQHAVAKRLVEMWNPEAGYSPEVIEIGCGTGYSTSLYLSRFTPRRLELWDMTIAENLPAESTKVACDAETRLFTLPDESVDLIFSASTIQWFNSLPAFLRNAARVLRPGGQLVVSTFGPENFAELHATLGTSCPYPSIDEIKTMLPENLALVKAETEKISAEFHDTLALLRHISGTGVNAINRNVSPTATRSLLRDYPRRPDGTASLTYNPIYLIITNK